MLLFDCKNIKVESDSVWSSLIIFQKAYCINAIHVARGNFALVYVIIFQKTYCINVIHVA